MLVENKKGQINNGLITAMIFAVLGLVITVIVGFVVVSTIVDTDLLSTNRVTTTVTNETAAFTNSSGYTLDHYVGGKVVPASFSITSATNGTSGGLPVTSGNYTLSSGVLTNATAVTYSNLSISYTYSNYTDEEYSVDKMRMNLTAGVENVSGKIPTILLIAAVVLILGVLVFFISAWKRMQLGGGI